MDTLVLAGGLPLNGEVGISGAKNAALPLLAATLLTPGEYILHNVPELRDTATMLRLLQAMGASWRREGTAICVNTETITSAEAPYELVKTMRASVLVLGPLLSRLGLARVSLPGGCAIGARPIDYHLEGFARLGVQSHLERGYVEARVHGQLKGGEVFFDVPSVTATENLLMAAVCAQGRTVIHNAAREPEVGNLVDMLRAMGAHIAGDGTDTLVIEGVARLRPAGIRVIPDRIETGTYMIAAAACGGRVRLTGCVPGHLAALTEKLRAAGITVEEEDQALVVSCACAGKTGSHIIQATDIVTTPYPGFPTDLQAQFMALMTLSEGSSVVHETIFENRFMHVAELSRMGADITVKGSRAEVRGRGRAGLAGAQVMATDLRASASLVIAGLAARGNTEISRIYHLERGYEKLTEKLQALGARIRRVSASPQTARAEAE